MATYFNGSHEIGPENRQTLYLMNPDFTSYSDATPTPTNMILLNPSTTSPNSISLAEPQYLVGIPLHSTDSAASASFHYNLLSPMIAYHSSAQQPLSLSLPTIRTADGVKTSGSQSFLINSRYLKLAQQLLDEVVSVRRGDEDGHRSWAMFNGDGDHDKSGEQIAKCSVEMTSSEVQELQMKKAKLLNMLDEVGQRYKNYHHQLQLVVSSFEAAAGIESAKAYTSLAFETISKRFRCLRDAIAGQIRAAVVCLGEEDITEGGGRPRVSRFRLVDRQLRQQRALQQLGMMQQNAWRPQRGLPERAVSVLRAWLFEHFLHPYPKDSDKLLLAKQTGLSKSQVSNWFINARVRLWKPMVEEMYIDEVKEHEQSNADEGTGNADFNEDSQHESIPRRTEQSYPQDPSIDIHTSSSNFHSRDSYDEEHDLFIHARMKEARSEESMNGQNENHVYPLITGSMIHGHGFEGYSVGEIERFNFKQFAPSLPSNGVSLTLGLTHYESLPLSGAQPPYLSSESIPFESNGFSSVKTPSAARGASNKYESLSTEGRKRFAAHLFPDFMA